MYIESPEIFRSWLASALAPLSDADPESLAKYVHALVKKDKPIDELKDIMIDQLDVFLQGETRGFVQLIFKNLESKEYLSFKKDPSPKEDKKEEPTSSVEPTPATKVDEPIDQPPQITKDEPTITSSEEKQTSQIQSSVVSEGTVKEAAAKVERKDEKKKDEREDRFRLNRSRLKRDGRSRSRSRSWDRSRRTRSRERERLRERTGPGYRNKSPPRRYERRRSYSSRSPSPGRYRTGSRSKSRSPKFTRTRFRNRSPGHSRSRSRSRDSPRSNRSFDHKDDPIVTVGRSTGRRCRDYDVKGYCMRGELCPYDHGTDPVVVSDLGLPAPLPYGVPPPGAPIGVPPPNLMPPNGPPPHIPPPSMMMRPPPNMAEYSPDAPSINSSMTWCRPPYQHGPRHGLPVMGFHGRELINVPVDARGQFQDGRHGHLDKRGLIDSRNTNCCLDIKKIPPGLNNITHLNNHFAKFGKIINIQVNYKKDPEAAMITFSSPAEASAAFKSTEAVLNNRFIKVFWHYEPKEGGRHNIKDRLGPQQMAGGDNHHNNGDTAYNENLAVNTATCLIKKPTVAVDPLKREKTTEELKAQALAKLKSNQEMIEKNQQMRKKSEDNRKEVFEMLRKRSQSLLEKHLQEQKELIKKLESGGLDEKQKSTLKETIKSLQERIEKVKTELLPLPAKKVTPVKRSKEEVQKDILDTELDIISKQQEGGDLVPLYKKLGALKSELLKLQGPANQRTNPIRPVLSSNPAVRHHPYANPHSLRKNNSKTVYKATVDHRPTNLLVSGYENDEKDQVLSHFREYGEIVDYIADDSTPSIVLNYKTRKEAEAAMNQGKIFQDRNLTVTWFNTPHMPTRRRNSSVSGPSYHMHAGRQVVLSSGSDAEANPDKLSELDYNEVDRGLESSEEFVLPDDEDDGDDDKEERSWRR